MGRLSQSERAVMGALNAHIARNEEVSLTELSRECHVAKSTVVKALKRAGFRGFREFTYNYRISRDIQHGALLPTKLVEGDEDALLSELCDALEHLAGKKSIVFSDGKRWAPLLANYVSRKLAMFDIFAPASYDYAMVNDSRMEPGAALFFLHQERGGASVISSGMGEGMVKAVRARGYETVVFTDSDERGVASYADILLRIADSADADLDLFSTKVIMVVERTLSKLSQRRAGGGRP